MNQHIQVGKTRKTHGTKGGLKLFVKNEFVEDVLKVDVAFLKIQGKLVPYFIEHFDYTNNLIVKFEDIDSPEDAVSITSKEFFIQAKDVTFRETDDSEDLVFSKLLGFRIEDEKIGTVGEILEVLQLPQQEMALILYQEKEVLIPLNHSLINSIDQPTRKVLMSLPEGLLEL